MSGTAKPRSLMVLNLITPLETIKMPNHSITAGKGFGNKNRLFFFFCKFEKYVHKSNACINGICPGNPAMHLTLCTINGTIN